MSFYQSPYRIFNLKPTSSQEEIDHYAQYLHERYAMLDEGSEVNTGTIKIEKKDIFKIVAELNDPLLKQHHVTIFEHKQFLNFLEYGHLNFFREQKRIVDVSHNADFLSFVAPYFGEQYGQSILMALKTNNIDNLKLLIDKDEEITQLFGDQIFDYVNDYVNTTVNDIKELQLNQGLPHISERELLSYLPNRTIELYNTLPDHFNNFRNLIGNEVYSLSMVLHQNYGRFDGAAVILNQGLKLKLDDALRSNMEKLASEFKFKSKLPPVVWIVVAVISLLYIIKFLEGLFYA